MKHSNLFFAFTLSLIILTVGCNDDDSAQDANTILLTNNTWDIYHVSGNGVDISNNSLNPFLDCTLDFYSNGRYIITNGNSYEGTWKFNSAQSSLIFDEGTVDEMLMNILELTENKLELQNIMTVEGESIILIIKAMPL
ncbi:MAG: lipocalin family protein [Bacteroidetes bacterium]|nr:lipocalin family protein [Bacteroidota bacterium]